MFVVAGDRAIGAGTDVDGIEIVFGGAGSGETPVAFGNVAGDLIFALADGSEAGNDGPAQGFDGAALSVRNRALS